MEQQRYYSKFLSDISTLVSRKFQPRSYAGSVNPHNAKVDKSSACSQEPIATTTGGGITVVDTKALLQQESVLAAIRTLSNRTEAAAAPKK
jgi:hypothetical protein